MGLFLKTALEVVPRCVQSICCGQDPSSLLFWLHEGGNRATEKLSDSGAKTQDTGWFRNSIFFFLCGRLEEHRQLTQGVHSRVCVCLFTLSRVCVCLFTLAFLDAQWTKSVLR